MNITEVIRQIRAVAFALDKIEVRGRENMNVLLGSIQTLDRTAAMLEQGLQEMDPPANKEPVEVPAE